MYGFFIVNMDPMLVQKRLYFLASTSSVLTHSCRHCSSCDRETLLSLSWKLIENISCDNGNGGLESKACRRKKFKV